MDYETFQTENARLENASVEERKTFYRQVIREETAPTKVRLMAHFNKALLFYQEGDFRRVREILEPLIFDYQSYEYTPELISCFNLMGVASHCEGEYALTRFFYQRGMQVAKENEEKSRYSYEYNNIALTYIAEGDFEKALEDMLLAERYLPECDTDMGAYVYVNLATTYLNLGEMDKALRSFQCCVNEHRGWEILPDDVLICGANLYYKLGDMDTYQTYQDRLLTRLDEMYASEFVDASQISFDCALDFQDDTLARHILGKMDSYMKRYPHEVNIGIWVEECKYKYAKMKRDEHAALVALERKDAYYRQVVSAAEKRHIKEIGHYFEINRKLRQSVDNETHANRVKSRFLANMSHDIRTPINGIIGMTEVIKACRSDEAKVDDCLEKIAVSSRLLLSIVNDILDMSKLESDTVVLEHKPFNLDTVCDEVCTALVCQAEKEGLTVHTTHDDVTHMDLIGSPVHLQKILSNLFSNSIKYNKPGGSIDISLREAGRTKDNVSFEFKISDTGIGMTQEFMDKYLFTPFVQENSAARSKYGGTGLGMSIVGQLVKKMKGTIKVESEVGEGTCYTIVLPFELDRSPAHAAPEETAPADIHGLNLLVAEDNELNMEIAEFVLSDAGADVEKAENGKQAVDLYHAAPAGTYDAVLMDLMMPVMDGYDAARAIRASDKADAKTIPIIAMSANTYQEDVQRCLAVGMSAHLGKPLFKDTLIRTIAKYCRKTRT